MWHDRHETRAESAQGTSYAPSAPSRRAWTMLCRIRNASNCSDSVMPASISDLDGPDRYGRLLKAPSAARREPRGKHHPDRCLRGPGHIAHFPGLEQHVHRLPSHERAPRELGVGQARSLSQQLEAGVARHTHPERPWGRRLRGCGSNEHRTVSGYRSLTTVHLGQVADVAAAATPTGDGSTYATATRPGHNVVASRLGILPNVTGFIAEEFNVRCIHRAEARAPTGTMRSCLCSPIRPVGDPN